jgi:hypothetical protein
VTAQARGQLVGLVFGMMAGQAVATAARLGVADLMGDRERAASELATQAGAHPGALTRLLRALSALQLTAEIEPDYFTLTEVGLDARVRQDDLRPGHGDRLARARAGRGHREDRLRAS